jgi:hypothetical protein
MLRIRRCSPTAGQSALDFAYAERVRSLLKLIDVLDDQDARFAGLTAKRLDAHRGYHLIQQGPGIGPTLAGCSSPSSVTCNNSLAPPSCARELADPTPPRVRYRHALRAHHQTGLEIGSVADKDRSWGV